MADTPFTYDSSTDLSLGQVPNEITDPVMYRELLDIHNALESLLKGSDNADAIFAAFIAKFRSFSSSPIIADYTVLITDGTIRVDASAGDVTVTLHPVDEGVGYRYNIKRIDETTNIVTMQGAGLELIDFHEGGVELDPLDSYEVKANDTGWDIQ